MAAVADRHPAGTPAQMFPRLGGAIEIKPTQLAGDGVALRTRLGSGGVKLLAFGGGMFPLQPLILPGSFDILPGKMVVIFKIIFVGHIKFTSRRLQRGTR